MNLRSVDRASARADIGTPDRHGRAGRFQLVLLGLVVALVVVATLGVTIGSVRLGTGDVWSVVGHHLGLPVSVANPQIDTIVWTVRVPRVLLAIIVGAGLATCGTALQAAVRNPIADPYLLGISSGATVGAVMVIAFGAGQALGTWALSSAAFVGAMAAALLVMVSTRRWRSPTRILLTGVAVGNTASALAGFLIYRAAGDGRARGVLFWMLGSLSGAAWPRLRVAAAAVVLGVIVLWLQGRRLNALLAGDDTASALGIDVDRFRHQLLLVTAVITATVVAASGSIGLVGLLLPHAGRFLVGNDHRRLVPVVALLGAVFLTLVDILARTAAAPEEIPVGIITSAIGAPYFLFILHRNDRRRMVPP